MADFDVDSYIAQNQNSGFDLDGYIAANSSSGPGAAQSGLEHLGNAAALGYLPQLQAAAAKVTPDPNASTDANLRAQGFTINSAPDSTYLSDRDANIARLAQESKEHPYASGAGTVGGAISSGIGASALAPIKGATLLARSLQAAKVGAVYGALSNPGDTPGEYSGLQVPYRVPNAAIGAGTGAVLQPAAEGVASAVGGVKNYFSNFAADKAAKAIGMTKADYARMGPDKARALGRAALDQGIVTPLSTPASIETTTDAMKTAAGQNLSQVIDQSQTQLDQMGPTGMMPSGRPIQATPVRPGTIIGEPQVQQWTPDMPDTVSSGGPASSPRVPQSPPQDVAAFRQTAGIQPQAQTSTSNPYKMAADVENLNRANASGFNPYAPPIEIPVSTVTPTIEQAGPSGDFLTPIQPRPAGRIDAPALAQQLQASGDASALSKIPGMEGLSSKINGFIDTLSKNPQDMNLRDAQSLRQGIDFAIKWGKRVPEMTGTQQYLVNIRNALSDAMSQSVDTAAAQSGAPLGALKAANANYSTLTKINDIASNRAAMNSANRAVGLTDTIAAGAGGGLGGTVGFNLAGPVGAEVGAPVGAAIGGGINKFGRTFGPSLQATGANQLSRIASAAAPGAQLVASNPLLAQSLLQSGVRSNQQNQNSNPPAQPSGPPLLGGPQLPPSNRSPATGPDAWAQKGVQTLGISDPQMVNQLLQSPKGKQLLIQASSFSPGSQAVKNIRDQIQKGAWK